MKKYIVGFVVGLAAAAGVAYAAARISMANQGRISATSGQVVECSVAGATIFSDTVPTGYTLTGQAAYQGQLAPSTP